MYISIFMIFFNIFIYFLIKRIKSRDNDYIKEKNRFNKFKLKYLNRAVNIIYITTYILYFIVILLFVGIDYIKDLYLYLLLFALDILIYIFIEYLTNFKRNKFKLIDKKYFNAKEKILLITFTVLFIIDKTNIEYKTVGEKALENHDFINNFNVILNIISFVIAVFAFKYIIKILLNNKNLCLYTYNKDNYLEDIKFYNRIDIKRGVNHLIYLTAFIVFFFIKFPFIYIFYIVVILYLMYLISKKVRKISNESDRLYKAVTIARQEPGIVYAFQFSKDILFLKKLIVFTIILAFSTLIYYGLGESTFGYTFIGMYMYLLYTIIEDKVYLIRYLASLNENFLDSKIYTINENKKISYIDRINIFNITLYKLIVVDTITYESNIILYDPELVIDEINIRINKSNIDDYIFKEDILYEE